MSPIDLVIEPLDTLFFRDGQSYVQGEPWQAAVESRFPPSPATLVGALRAALARSLGWSGRAREPWSAAVTAELGDGDDLGPLRFRGPLLRRGGDVLFPAPAALLRTAADVTGSDCLLRLRPGPPRHCDLGPAVCLPVPASSTAGLKPLAGAWIDQSGLQAWLSGQTPAADRIVCAGDLWRLEARVGIARDPDSRTTGEGAIYSPQHVRLGQGVSLWAQISGSTPARVERAVSGQPHPLGGESRGAWILPEAGNLRLPGCPALRPDADRLRYSVLLLTPAAVSQPPRPGDNIDGLPGKLVSACLPAPSLIGGWDSRRHVPLPPRPHLPAGSVLFIETHADQLDAVQALHGKHIGKRSTWGFGWILVGAW